MPLLRDLSTITSAYVAAHASNPVDWWAWGDDAFAEARRRDVPIFLSVGYAACHWCHVMAHESFEDPAIAALLRDGFVAVKVDREERPDVDQVYMAATQLISGHGGWPMSVFLLPDGRPFTGGTYYPPADRPGLVGFPHLLMAIAQAWTTRRDDVEEQATSIQRALTREIRFSDFLSPRTDQLDLLSIDQQLAAELVQRVDENGGHGAPRFPRPSYVQALLRTGEVASAERILAAMARNGLYDHIEGGFARYSVDATWHVPHFEQMLSDQALLAQCYYDAARSTGTSDWRTVGDATLAHVLRVFRVPDGFASSLDADAGGHEGAHVTWTPDEVENALRTNGCVELLQPSLTRWRIASPGQFEGRSIPRLAIREPFATPPMLAAAHTALRQARAERPQPQRDEKVILEWNAMLASALFASDRPEWHSEARHLLLELRTSHRHNDQWWRTAQRSTLATCADIAWYLTACVDAFSATGDDVWTAYATEASRYLMTHFWDGELPTVHNPNVGGGFFANSDDVSDLFTRPKELFDGATPSSHAIATRAMARLAIVTGDEAARAIALRLTDLAHELLATHPMAVIDTVAAAHCAVRGIAIVVPGDANELTAYARANCPPLAVVVSGTGSSPLLRDRSPGWAYVCEGGQCLLPVATVAELAAVLKDWNA